MSLLLEALKKAELAKQAAKESPPDASEPPFTRDKLPDITQPMEIRSEDLSLTEYAPAPGRMENPPLELAPESPPPRAAPQPAPAARAAPGETTYLAPDEPGYTPPGEAAERKQAQQLFEAKELDVNPRKPFYLTVGALGLFALGTVGYFWYQMQPKNTYKIPPPSAQSAPPPVAPAPAAAAATPAESGTPAAVTVTPPTGAQAAVLAKDNAAPRALAPAAAAPTAAAPAAPRGPVFAREGAPAATAGGGARAPQGRPAKREGDITITPARVQSDPLLEGAFQAFNMGDLPRARADYQQVRRYNPDGRDALLGLAAVETQARNYDAAESFYLRLLELDPRDAHAQAGIIGLRGQGDPQAAESRLKSMIASQPDAGFLHFTLGNQYAAQSRWAEAQQAYFKAYSSDPEHPDFAYNLAISLDRIHQVKPALEYYRRALALAEGRPASFDRVKASNRVSQLER